MIEPSRNVRPARRALAIAVLAMIATTGLAACGGDSIVRSVPGPTPTASVVPAGQSD